MLFPLAFDEVHAVDDIPAKPGEFRQTQSGLNGEQHQCVIAVA